MGYQAITTKYLGPTDRRGSRVKAIAAAGSMTIPWDCALNSDRNHAQAALALAQKFNWTGRYIGGGLPDGSGSVFVLDTEDTRDSFYI